MDTEEAFNAFVAETSETLTAVNFFTAADDVTYTVTVYDNFVSGALSDELSSKTGTIDYTGFHTIDLDTQVELTAGEDFYIYLHLSDGGQPYDRSSIVPVLLGADSRTLVESSASPNESFYKVDDDWVDFYDYDDPSGYLNTGNFCIKGLTIINSGVGINSPGQEENLATLSQNVPNPVYGQTRISYHLEQNAHVELSLFSMDGKRINVLVDEQQSEIFPPF